ncbi:MAG: septum formation initiator family protein [Pseudonocardia sp.]|nr:septum formation initiator family protein [Pseudonocardia sp.]
MAAAGTDSERTRARSERARGRGGARPTGGKRVREPRLTRSRSRAGGVVAATTGLLGLSSTRRAAVLAIVVCALTLTVAVPLRNYVAQRQELTAVSNQQRALAAEVDQLTERRARLSDPEEVAVEARSRLGYVKPGEIPFQVQLPQVEDPAAAKAAAANTPWYRQLWSDVTVGSPL